MIQGVILAAGEGRRFRASRSGATNTDKLLATVPQTSQTVLASSAQAVQRSVPVCCAVIQPQQSARQLCLEALGVKVLPCKQAANGMGYALAHAVQKTSEASGWLIALGDMPWVTSELITALCQQLKQPDQIILPMYQGQKGHPVLFGAHWRESLMALTGDRGAKALIDNNLHKVVTISWGDTAILRDVDVVADLSREC